MNRLWLLFFLLLSPWPAPAMASACARETELAPPQQSLELDRPGGLLPARTGAETLGSLGRGHQHGGDADRDPRCSGYSANPQEIAPPAGGMACVYRATADTELLPARFEHLPYLPTAPPTRP